MVSLQEFKKRKEWLVCVDSDGCAMNTMDSKHIRCFGPCMVEEWGLAEWKEEILFRWNEVNLYTLTRGINRFKGLARALKEANEKYLPIDGVDEFWRWAETSPELSNEALQKEIEKQPNEKVFQKALSWSKAVNSRIKTLPEEDLQPFDGAKEALAFAKQHADVAVVSSANLSAVLEEWEKHGLLAHVDVVLAQNCGSKAYCIAELLKKGYEPDKVVMCGDALGDMQAAEKNGVHYYPILVRKEKASWDEFVEVGLQKLCLGEYGGEYETGKKKEFLKNLGE